MQSSCPYCDHPEVSVLRLVLIRALFCADDALLALLADVWQQLGLLHLEEEPTEREPGAPHVPHA